MNNSARDLLDELRDMEHVGGIDIPFTRRLHDRLASQGLIAIMRHDRGARITITEAGREALEQADA